MSSSTNNAGTAAGTISGTLLAFLGNIYAEDLVRTSVLAVIGAVVSFTASLLLKWIAKKLRSK